MLGWLRRGSDDGERERWYPAVVDEFDRRLLGGAFSHFDTVERWTVGDRGPAPPAVLLFERDAQRGFLVTLQYRDDVQVFVWDGDGLQDIVWLTGIRDVPKLVGEIADVFDECFAPRTHARRLEEAGLHPSPPRDALFIGEGVDTEAELSVRCFAAA